MILTLHASVFLVAFFCLGLNVLGATEAVVPSADQTLAINLPSGAASARFDPLSQRLFLQVGPSQSSSLIDQALLYLEPQPRLTPLELRLEKMSGGSGFAGWMSRADASAESAFFFIGVNGAGRLHLIRRNARGMMTTTESFYELDFPVTFRIDPAGLTWRLRAWGQSGLRRELPPAIQLPGLSRYQGPALLAGESKEALAAEYRWTPLSNQPKTTARTAWQAEVKRGESIAFGAKGVQAPISEMVDRQLDQSLDIQAENSLRALAQDSTAEGAPASQPVLPPLIEYTTPMN
jgi:hypothetical protein